MTPLRLLLILKTDQTRDRLHWCWRGDSVTSSKGFWVGCLPWSLFLLLGGVGAKHSSSAFRRFPNLSSKSWQLKVHVLFALFGLGCPQNEFVGVRETAATQVWWWRGLLPNYVVQNSKTQFLHRQRPPIRIDVDCAGYPDRAGWFLVTYSKAANRSLIECVI